MAQMISEIIVKNELRPCVVNGENALFHKWAESESVILKFPFGMDGDTCERIKRAFDREGVLLRGVETEKIKAVFALVEYEDGRMDKVDPSAVCFIDDAHSGYSFTEREARNNGKIY